MCHGACRENNVPEAKKRRVLGEDSSIASEIGRETRSYQARMGPREKVNKSGRMPRPLDAVPCTGTILSRVNSNHSYRCGKGEPGERVCVAGPLLGG